MNLTFEVHGKPQPQGSARAFVVKGRAVITTANPQLKSWRQDIAAQAEAAMIRAGFKCSDAPVSVRAEFCFTKPKSTKKSVVDKITKPDVDKLMRGLLDGMTGIVFSDDAQVVAITALKRFDVCERTVVAVFF